MPAPHTGNGTSARGRGRWPTDKGFEEWYGPPRTYDEALSPTDPWYDPDRDPVSRMLEIKRGEPDVTEGEQLTLEVRRDCDAEYLRRAEAFIRRSVQGDAPFFLYFNHSLLHMPVIPRAEFRDAAARATGPTACSSWIPTSARCSTCSSASPCASGRSTRPPRRASAPMQGRSTRSAMRSWLLDVLV